MANAYLIFRPRLFLEFECKGSTDMTAVGEWFKHQGVKKNTRLPMFSTNTTQPLSVVGIDYFVCAAHLVPLFHRIHGRSDTKSAAQAERKGATTATHRILNVFASREDAGLFSLSSQVGSQVPC